MKKTFTLFCALLSMSAMIQAQTDLIYNFSSSVFATYQANPGTTLSSDIVFDDNLTFYDTSGKISFKADGENYFTAVEYAYRLNFNGKWNKNNPYTAAIGVKVSGPCTIQLVCTSTSSDEVRDLLIYEDTGSDFNSDNVKTLAGTLLSQKTETVDEAIVLYTYEGGGSAEIIIGGSGSWNLFFLGVYYGTVSAPETGSDGGSSSDSSSSSDDGDNAISSIQADGAVEVARYNLLGQEITEPQKGINIVKYSNGATEKVLVK